MPIDREAVSEAIRNLRKERGLTQVQLANALGISPTSVYRWEAGSSSPDIGMLIGMWDYAISIGASAASNLSDILAENVAALKPLVGQMRRVRQEALNEQTATLPEAHQRLVGALIRFLQTDADKDDLGMRVLRAVLQPERNLADSSYAVALGIGELGISKIVEQPEVKAKSTATRKSAKRATKKPGRS